MQQCRHSQGRRKTAHAACMQVAKPERTGFSRDAAPARLGMTGARRPPRHVHAHMCTSALQPYCQWRMCNAMHACMALHMHSQKCTRLGWTLVHAKQAILRALDWVRLSLGTCCLRAACGTGASPGADQRLVQGHACRHRHTRRTRRRQRHDLLGLNPPAHQDGGLHAYRSTCDATRKQSRRDAAARATIG